MLWQIYLFLLATAHVASFISISAIGRRDLKSANGRRISIYILTSVYASFIFALCAIASWNIEVREGAETATFQNEYLFLFWSALAFVNLLYTLVGPWEFISSELDEADLDQTPGPLGGQDRQR